MIRKLYLCLGGFALLTALAACVLPSQVTPQPPPTLDSQFIATAIAGTAQADAVSVAPTIVPTETTVPTAIVSYYGTSLTKSADGSTIFVDHRAGVQIVFPPNWLALRVGELEYFQAWEREGGRNPDLIDAISGIQNLDLNRFRVSAFDLSPGRSFYGSIPKINVVYIQGDARTLKQVEADERKSPSILKNYKYLPPKFETTAGGLEVLMLQYQWSAASQDNQPYTGLYMGYLFKVASGTVAIDLFIPMDVREAVEPELRQIVENVTLLGQ